MMKLCIVFLSCFITFFVCAENNYSSDITVITTPYMNRPSLHRKYADDLLVLALEFSKEKYGPYKIIKQNLEKVLGRQLLELEKGEELSLAISMPRNEWLEKTIRVKFPIMKGLASYRLFFADKTRKNLLQNIYTLDDLKKLYIGQGIGWSTSVILEDNDFKVVYSSKYDTLFPMLKAERFELLMRGIYEVEPELRYYKQQMPDLYIVDDLAIYTYLPMYFFVSKKQPKLAERIEYGLNKANDSGEFDQLYNYYFEDVLTLLYQQKRKVFNIHNTNINDLYFKSDKPYLLDYIIELETNILTK